MAIMVYAQWVENQGGRWSPDAASLDSGLPPTVLGGKRMRGE